MKEILLRESTIDLNKEHFWCVGLANNSKLLYIELVSLGTLSQSIVEPMDIFAWALQKQVAMLILVHNHPSGENRNWTVPKCTLLILNVSDYIVGP